MFDAHSPLHSSPCHALCTAARDNGGVLVDGHLDVGAVDRGLVEANVWFHRRASGNGVASNLHSGVTIGLLTTLLRRQLPSRLSATVKLIEPLSRRDLFGRAMAAGVGITFLSSFHPGDGQAQSLEDAELLRRQLAEMNDRISDQSPLVQEWLRNSEIVKGAANQFDQHHHTAERQPIIAALMNLCDQLLQEPHAAEAKRWLLQAELVKATKNEFSDEVQKEWANDWAIIGSFRIGSFRSETDFPVWFGITFHPWMHIDGYAPNRTLNTAEIEFSCFKPRLS